MNFLNIIQSVAKLYDTQIFFVNCNKFKLHFYEGYINATKTKKLKCFKTKIIV